MRRGLVFGKFMPLHRGHQMVIDTAFVDCDEVTIVIYDSKVPDNPKNMSIQKRLGWLKTLYPQAKNIIALDDPLRDNLDRDKPEYAQVYADQLAFLGKFNRVYTSERQYKEFSKLIGAKHVCVDSRREEHPISGTKIREYPYGSRQHIDKLVYNSLIQKVVFVGTESTGKTTLAKAMGLEYLTPWAHEYGRELWREQNWTGTFEDMLKIGTTQYQREENMLFDCDKYLFCDTNAWTTLQWSLMAYGTADKRLYDLVERTKDEYVWFLCDNDFGWIDDGTRELHGVKSVNFQQQQRANLNKLGVTFWELNGSLEDRKEQVKGVLDYYEH